jgi:hypothetical protein
MEPLRRSLVVNAITNDEDLIDDLLNEPTVTNVYSGQNPTYPSEARDASRRLPGRTSPHLWKFVDDKGVKTKENICKAV